MIAYKFTVGQIIKMTRTGELFEIVFLGSTKDNLTPIYFVRTKEGNGYLWGLFNEEIEAI